MAEQDIAPVVPRYAISGLRQVFREVRKFEPALVRETQRDMRAKMGAPLQQAGRDILTSRLRYGDRPMRNWIDRGRLGWNTNRVVNGFKVASGGRYQKQTHTWPMISLRQTNAAGAMFDWAGRSKKYIDARGRQGRGVAFVNNLQANIRFGSIKGSKYSRTVFPAIVRERETIVRELEDITKDLERKVTERVNR